MILNLVTAPTALPVSLADAKAYMRVTFSDQDFQISSLIAAATAYCENFTGRALISQVWDYYLDAWPESGIIYLPKPPIISVDGVYYNDADGNEQEFAASSYVVSAGDNPNLPARIALADGESWPTAQEQINAIRIRFTAGYVDLNSPPEPDVPEALKVAIMQLAGTLYAARETVMIGVSTNQVPWGADQLMRQYRVERSFA